MPPTTFELVAVVRIVDDESGTQLESPCTDVDGPVP